MEILRISLQCILIGGKRDDRQAIYAELIAMDKIRSNPSPYVVDFYGALIHSVSGFTRFSPEERVLLMQSLFLDYSEQLVHLHGVHDHHCRHVLPDDASDFSKQTERHRSIRSTLCP